MQDIKSFCNKEHINFNTILRGDIGGVETSIGKDVQNHVKKETANTATWRYTSTSNLGREQKQKIARWASQHLNHTIEAEQVTILPFRSKVTSANLTPLMKDGPVLMPYPTYPAHLSNILLSKREAYMVDVRNGLDGFIDTIKEMAKHVSSLIIPSPGNPISNALTPHQAWRLGTIIKEHPDINIEHDAAYAGYPNPDSKKCIDPLFYAGSYRDSNDTVESIQGTVISASKLLNVAGGPAIYIASPNTIKHIEHYCDVMHTSAPPLAMQQVLGSINYGNTENRYRWQENHIHLLDTLKNAGLKHMTIYDSNSSPFVTLDAKAFCKEIDKSPSEVRNEFLKKHGMTFLTADSGPEHLGAFGPGSYYIFRFSVTGSFSDPTALKKLGTDFPKFCNHMLTLAQSKATKK